MRVCEQQQMEEVRAALSVAGEPSPYSTDSVIAESINLSSGASSPPTPDGHPSTHNDKMKLMRKMLKKKFAQPYSRVSPSKVRMSHLCICLVFTFSFAFLHLYIPYILVALLLLLHLIHLIYFIFIYSII